MIALSQDLPSERPIDVTISPHHSTSIFPLATHSSLANFTGLPGA